MIPTAIHIFMLPCFKVSSYYVEIDLEIIVQWNITVVFFHCGITGVRCCVNSREPSMKNLLQVV